MGEPTRNMTMLSSPMLVELLAQAQKTASPQKPGVSDCVDVLLFLASPRAESANPSKRSRSPPAASQVVRPVKIHKTQGGSERVVRAEPVTSKGVAQPSLQPGSEAMINRWVELKRGKYKGRTALIVGMTAKKFRVRVTGVELQLEFYPSMFKEIEAGRLSPAQTSVSIPTPAKQPTPARTAQPTPASAEPVKTVVVPESSQIIVAKPVRRLPPQLQRKLNPPKLHLLSDQKVTTCRDGQLTLDIISPGPRIAAV